MRAAVSSLVLALVACTAPTVVSTQPAGATPDSRGANVQQVNPITEISVESNCFGCAAGSVLSLHRDGRAQLTVTGNARLGTADEQRSGRITATDFDALAQVLLDQGFFAMAESYADPALQDGEWATVRAVRAGQDKQVFRRGDAAPASLRAVEQAVAAVQRGIRFGNAADASDPRNRGPGK